MFTEMEFENKKEEINGQSAVKEILVWMRGSLWYGLGSSIGTCRGLNWEKGKIDRSQNEKHCKNRN